MSDNPGALESPGGQDPSPGSCDSAETERVRALQTALDEKDQLVTALTVQLEDVCERLDRVQRTGADRSVAVSGMPRELVEEQRSVLDQLQEAVGRWEEMQAAAALGRIETQVAELRDLLVDGLRGGGPVAPDVPPDEEPPHEDPAANWETMKAAMLSDGTSAPSESLSEYAPEPYDAAAEWIDPPPPVDLSGAPDGLRQAIEQRDEYIVWLIRRLRRAESPRQLMEGVDSDEATARLAELERMFDEKLRLAEIELSLERARLAREDARLRTLDDQMQKDSRRSQAGPAAGPAQPEDRGETESAKSRRWRRMLGIGGDGQ